MASPTKHSSHTAVDEITPLLLAAEAGQPISEEPLLRTETKESVFSKNEDKNDDDASDSLKVLQIFLLCYARTVEPLAFFCIFPFIPQMIRRTGIQEENIGFYSGLIESLFSVTQTALMLGWGKAADRFGRKPVLVFSLIGMSTCTAGFGFCDKSLWGMIALRSFGGAFGGTLVTIRTMISENATPSTQARAFSFFAFSGNMGIFLGPGLGALFAEPAKNLSSTFGRIPLFQQFPYALPTLVTGSLGLSAALICALFLDETLDRKALASLPTKHSTSTRSLLRIPGVPMILYLYTHVMMLGMAYTAVMPVFYYTSISLGGWALTARQSSIFMAFGGLMQAFWLLFVFPPLQKRIGTAGVLRLCAYCWPCLFILNPLYNLFLRLGFDKLFWVLAPPTIVLTTGVAMAFTGAQLAVNEISPSPAMLGTLNALALTTSSAIRAVTPGLFASLFATSVRTQLFGGYMVWGVLLLNTACVAVGMKWLPTAISRGRQDGKK